MMEIVILTTNTSNFANKVLSPEFLDISSIVGTVCSIIGLCFTVYIFYTTKSIKEKYDTLIQSQQLIKDKKTLINELKSCSEILGKNGDLDYGIADLARILRLLENYSLSMKYNDKKNLKKLKKYIVKQHISIKEVQVAIQGIIGFLQSNHDKKFEII
ncbi:hypothetical protein ACM1TL_05425 [Lysinibacillus capsici]|uniref:hypothetical protein n=1 Tax=Lysinibacillus TaxID=400634 RepID=UPI00365CD197